MKRLVLDVETTGLSPRFNKTLTVGMLLVDVDQEFLEVLDSNHIFIKHANYRADPAALAVNKIDLAEHSKRAVLAPKACGQINDFVESNGLHKTPLLGHNIGFDKGFLHALFDRGGISPKLHDESEDTMRIWNRLKRSGNVPDHLRSNLQTVADYFKVDYSKAHDALADCHITAQVYHQMLGIV